MLSFKLIYFDHSLKTKSYLGVYSYANLPQKILTTLFEFIAIKMAINIYMYHKNS